jgi:signal transduction histidine kinase
VIILNVFVSLRFTETLDVNLDRALEMELTFSEDEPIEDPLFRGFDERLAVVYYNEDDGITKTVLFRQSSLSESEANAYALEVLSTGDERGWADGYRYLVGQNETDQIIILTDGDFFLYAITSFRSLSLIALGVTVLLVAVFLYFGSNKAVNPIVESNKRQKQFMTDASHELKTPITVISANTEILKMSDQNNEWLESISKQTRILTELIQQIIKMSKLDEPQLELIKEEFELNEVIDDVLDDFIVVMKQKKITLTKEIDKVYKVNAHKQSIEEVLKILIDNAVKYCDEGLDININVEANKKTHIYISNAFKDVDHLEFDALFNRFYRSDSARASDGSFGLGLSIAASIVDYHHGQIKAYKKDENHLTIEVVLP